MPIFRPKFMRVISSRYLLCIVALLSFVHLSFAASQKNQSKDCIVNDDKAMEEIRTYLDTLDSAFARVEVSREVKRKRIEALESKSQDVHLGISDKYTYLELLYDEYSTYNSSKMFDVASQLYDISISLGDIDRIVKSQLKLVQTYLWAGAFKEAQELMGQIDTTSCRLDTRVDYLKGNFELQFESAFFSAATNFFRETYVNRLQDITDEVSSLLPIDDRNTIYIKEKNESFNGRYRSSCDYALKRLESPNVTVNERAEILSSLGFCNLELGDTLSAVKYMVGSAVIALDMGSCQEPTLRKLAETVYPLGEYERSYQYISLAMDNAKMFGSSYRIYESAISQPHINKILYDRSTNLNHKMLVLSTACVLLLIILIVLFCITFKQYKSLQRSTIVIESTNAEMARLNMELDETNSKLQEANAIKSTYIEHVLTQDSMILSMTETLVEDIEKKVKVRQYDDIIPYIYRFGFLKKRKEIMTNFDESFLMLFPKFVEDVNKLLSEDSAYPVGTKELPVELRILALMRLGINKSVTIGNILNISDSTVRNYKTKLRNKSHLDNEEFDDAIRNIAPSI